MAIISLAKAILFGEEIETEAKSKTLLHMGLEIFDELNMVHKGG